MLNLKGRFELCNGKRRRILPNQATQKIAQQCLLAIQGTTMTGYGWIAIGTGQAAAQGSDLALGAEVLRMAATLTLQSTEFTSDTLRFYATFVAGSVVNVYEIGIFNSATGGDLGARGVLLDSNGSPAPENYSIGNTVELYYYLQVGVGSLI